MKTTIAVAVTLAAFVATPAFAAHKKGHKHRRAAVVVVEPQVQPRYYGQFVFGHDPNPNNVYAGNRYVGTDPDPNVRTRLLYDYYMINR